MLAPYLTMVQLSMQLTTDFIWISSVFLLIVFFLLFLYSIQDPTDCIELFLLSLLQSEIVSQFCFSLYFIVLTLLKSAS